jgi:COMPASS component SPP1
MLKPVASRRADPRNVNPKDLCGYDSRLTWNDDEFNEWRSSESGREALRLGSLPLPSDEDVDGDVGMSGVQSTSDQQQSTCMKKRCSRHYEWAKLHIEDNKFEIGANSNFLQGLEKEESEIIQRARVRVREIRAGGVGGTVEFHGCSVPKENKEDRELGMAPVVEQHHDVEMKEEEVKEENEEGKVNGEVRVEEEQQDDAEDKEVDMVDAIAASI